MRRSVKKSSSVLWRLILWSVLIVVVALLGAGFYGYRWVQGYLKGDAFRAQVAAQLGRTTKSEAVIETLTWTGQDVSVTQASLAPKRDQAWKSIKAGGIQGSLDFSAARDGVWRITRLTADSLRMDMRSAIEIPKELPPEWEEQIANPVPLWLRRWIPTRTQVDEVQVQTFDFVPSSAEAGVSATNLTLTGKPSNDRGAWQLRSEGGKLVIPGLREPFRLSGVSSRLDADALVIHDASARWLGDSEVTARGDVPFGKAKPWGFNGAVRNLDMRHLLTPDWNSRLNGMLEGDYEVKPTVMKGKVRVKNGIVQNMPMLNQVATFTRVERFRRIVLDVAKADMEHAGDRITVSNLDLQSSGLIRVEGGLVIQGDQINGDLLVGVAPDTLNWILGSRERVFTQTRADAPGYVWTNVRISGPLNSPSEDLTNRILIAMGLAPLDLAGKGVELLTGTAAGMGAAGVTKEVMDAGKSVIEGSGGAAGKVIETGVDVLKGVVPIFGK
jgi:hypothetical protein